MNVVSENAEVAEQLQQVRLPATAGLAFALNLVSYLSAHGPFKVVLIDLLRSSSEVDHFKMLLTYFLDIFNYVSNERNHQLCQEHIVVRMTVDALYTYLLSSGPFQIFIRLEYFAIVVRRRYRINN